MQIIFLIWQPHQQILNLYTIDAKYWLQRRSAVLTMNSRMIGDIWNLTGNLSNRDQTFYKKQQQRIQERQMRKVCTDYRQNEAGETYRWETLYKTTKKQHQTKSGSKQREWTGRYRHNFKKEPRTEGFPSGKTTPPFYFHFIPFHFPFISFLFVFISFHDHSFPFISDVYLFISNGFLRFSLTFFISFSLVSCHYFSFSFHVPFLFFHCPFIFLPSSFLFLFISFRLVQCSFTSFDFLSCPFSSMHFLLFLFMSFHFISFPVIFFGCRWFLTVYRHFPWISFFLAFLSIWCVCFCLLFWFEIDSLPLVSFCFLSLLHFIACKSLGDSNYM